ncbi:MAG: G5 domain-containing protein [Anaerolineales bacterium]|jgi:hypothetical protein
MRLYHLSLVTFLLLLAAAACSPVQAPQTTIQVTVQTADERFDLELPQGSTAEDAINAAGLTIGELDRIEPPLYTLLTSGAVVNLIRVSEEFDIEQVVIPYESRTLRNESLPEGEQRLIQAGVNGLQEITYRRVYEDNREVSRSPVKSVIVQEAVPEIVMVGSQSPFAPVSLPGKIAYLVGGNAWILDGATGDRRPVVTTADLDGRVFSLSPDGEWLLYTRASTQEDTINSLWVARLDDSDLFVDLEAENIVHFADWVPNAVLQVAYSTVEPRSTAPGWQANNDLTLVSFSPTGWVSDPELIVDANAGGVYGWWGTTFAWSPAGDQLAFVRPDGAGLVNFETGGLEKILDVTPLQTFGDWAWVPGLAWNPDGSLLYTVEHAPQPGTDSPETSQVFDVTAVPLEDLPVVRLVSQAGMFAQPIPSPEEALPSGENAYQVAYLQAIFPTQSETSNYQLVVMDRDGSNRQVLFPESGAPGLQPQRLIWAPEQDQVEDSYDLAFLYQGNLWLVDVQSGKTRQLTGDGLISRIDWK